MRKPFEIEIDVAGFDDLIYQYGLEKGGRVHKELVRLVEKYSQKYVPEDDAKLLKNTAKIVEEGEAIDYIQPYSRYHWFGKLMVDPITGKGAFHDPVSGRFWSRKGVQKKLTQTDLQYQGAPKRGPHWTERMWEEEGSKILKELEKKAERK